MKNKKPSSLSLIAIGFVLPMVASRAARAAFGAGYEAFTRQPPPKNPAEPGVLLKDAFVWTALAGAIGGVASMGVRRALAETIVPAEGHDMGEAVADAVE